MGDQGCVVAPSQVDILALISKLKGMGYVLKGAHGEFYLTESAKRELTYAFSLHKPRMLCEPRQNHFEEFGYGGSTAFELLKYLVDKAGWTWRPARSLKSGVRMLISDKTPANCILYGGQSLATLRVFAMAAREPDKFIKKNVIEVEHCLKDIKYEALFKLIMAEGNEDGSQESLEAALEDVMQDAEDEEAAGLDPHKIHNLADCDFEDTPSGLNIYQEELSEPLFVRSPRGSPNQEPAATATVMQLGFPAENVSAEGLLRTESARKGGAASSSSQHQPAIELDMLKAADEIKEVVKAAGDLGLEVYQGHGAAASWKWNGFVVSYVAPGPASTSAWQARCPYHRLSRVSDCKKRITVPEFRSYDSQKATLSRLLWWCGHAPVFERQREHIKFHPLPEEVPEVEFVLGMASHLPPVEDAFVATDDAMDVATTFALPSEKKRRGRPPGSGRGKAQAKPKQVGGQRRGRGRGAAHQQAGHALPDQESAAEAGISPADAASFQPAQRDSQQPQNAPSHMPAAPVRRARGARGGGKGRGRKRSAPDGVEQPPHEGSGPQPKEKIAAQIPRKQRRGQVGAKAEMSHSPVPQAARGGRGHVPAASKSSSNSTSSSSSSSSYSQQHTSDSASGSDSECL